MIQEKRSREKVLPNKVGECGEDVVKTLRNGAARKDWKRQEEEVVGSAVQLPENKGNFISKVVSGGGDGRPCRKLESNRESGTSERKSGLDGGEKLASGKSSKRISTNSIGNGHLRDN